MDDNRTTTIKITKRNLRKLLIIKALERKDTFNEVINYLLNKYYDNSKFNNELFEQ